VRRELETIEKASAGVKRYLYNGKELQQGTDWLDYGARMYDAAIGRWMVPDVLGELRVYESPYCYVGNNPISRIDPDGRYWGDKNKDNDKDDRIARQQANQLQKRGNTLDNQITKLTNRIANTSADNKDKLSNLNSQLSNAQAMKSDVQAAQTELTAMGNSTDISFTFNTVGSTNGITNITHGTTEAGGQGDLQITINNFGTFESKAHELKHGYQVLNGQMSPSNRGSDRFNLSNIPSANQIEVEAYRREYAVGGSMPNSNNGTLINPTNAVVQRMSDINAGWVTAIYMNSGTNLNDYPYLSSNYGR
jgi:RHS repeat-associated protein